jgi:BRCT domain type II-containing protein
LRRCLQQSETSLQQTLGTPNVGVWVDTFLSTEPSSLPSFAASASSSSSDSGSDDQPVHHKIDPVLAKRYGLDPETGLRLRGPAAPVADAPAAAEAPAPTPTPTTKASTGSKRVNTTNEISVIKVTVRAVKLKDQAWNGQCAFEVEKVIKASPMFDAKETQLTGQLDMGEDSSPSFSFPLSLVLKRPIKL